MVLAYRPAQDHLDNDANSLFVEYRTALGEEERRSLRKAIVLEYGHLAHSLARRYSHRGEATEDLSQVALAALIAAIDRFDPDRGATFGSFAYSSIKGELKKHFRDTGWAVRVPRSLQELALAITSCERELVQKLGRSPTPAELASACGEKEEDVLQALDVARNYTAVSLDAPVETESGEGGRLADFVGFEDERFDRCDYLTELPGALGKLTQVEREVIYYRFFEGELQWQIAERLGVSQMQVSRLVRRALEKLRGALDDHDSPGGSR